MFPLLVCLPTYPGHLDRTTAAPKPHPTAGSQSLWPPGVLLLIHLGSVCNTPSTAALSISTGLGAWYPPVWPQLVEIWNTTVDYGNESIPTQRTLELTAMFLEELLEAT